MLRLILRWFKLVGDITSIVNGRYHKRLVNRSIFRRLRWR